MSKFNSAQRRITTKLKSLIFEKVYHASRLRRLLVDQFMKFFYGSPDVQTGWVNTFWLGIRALKNPLDLWVFQEIIYETRPDIIIETGTFQGGSAFFLASICDLLVHGTVITIDIQPSIERPQHPRIVYLNGSSTSDAILRTVGGFVFHVNSVMVILDSAHDKDHVLEELRSYSSFVTVGNYLIVEDTNINDHPVFSDHGPGPMEAVKEFLQWNREFVVDETREKYLLTLNPRGYLKRVKGEREFFASSQ